MAFRIIALDRSGQIRSKPERVGVRQDNSITQQLHLKPFRSSPCVHIKFNGHRYKSYRHHAQFFDTGTLTAVD